MAVDTTGDQRVRRRVTTILATGLINTGTTSKANPDIRFANRHYIAIALKGTVSGGNVTVRGRPITGGDEVGEYTPIGIEAVALTSGTLAFAMAGFFSAFLVTITSAVTGGGSISVVVNSTIESS